MGIVNLYGLLLRVAIGLALVGELKACTLVMLGKAAERHEMMSYSKFTRMLTGPMEAVVHRPAVGPARHRDAIHLPVPLSKAPES